MAYEHILMSSLSNVPHQQFASSLFERKFAQMLWYGSAYTL